MHIIYKYAVTFAGVLYAQDNETQDLLVLDHTTSGCHELCPRYRKQKLLLSSLRVKHFDVRNSGIFLSILPLRN